MRNFQELNIVCIIPARGGSKGLPKKNIMDFYGKPLISWSIDQSLSSKYINKNVYVTSDCDEILSVAKKYCANTIKRPDDISGDKASSESALLHAFEKIEKELKHIDLIVFLQATSPLRESIDIDNAIEKVLDNDLDSVFSGSEIDDFLIWSYDKNNNLESLNYNYQNRQRRQDISVQYVENGSIYVFKPEILLRENNRIGGKIGISIMDKWKMHEIDTFEDKELCEYYAGKKNLK